MPQHPISAQIPRLAARDLQPELMDQPGLDPPAHRQALAGLARINRFSFSRRILWPAIASLAREQPDRSLSLLDVATGGGDIPIGLWRAARREKIRLNISGCDISATALDHARIQAHKSGACVHFFQHDPLATPPIMRYDIITASLFLHHLTDDQAVGLLGNLARAAGSLIIINDLERSRAGWLLARAGTLLLSRSPIVHVDGPRSVAAAFTTNEARVIAERAGLTPVSITRHWPFRYRMVWRRG